MLFMAGLGVRNDVPPNAVQPRLVDGIHLRWAFDRQLGFPWFGFYLFRRPHRRGTPSWLSEVTSGLPTGTWPNASLTTPQGELTSDRNLVLTDDFPPAGAIEFDLDDRDFLRFTFPPQSPARRVEVRVGFHGRSSEPSPEPKCADFENRQPGSGPNPRTEEGIRFEAFHSNGSSMPNTHIQRIQTTSGPLTGLDCAWTMLITLPRPASAVDVKLTARSAATIEAFNEDGTSAAETEVAEDPRQTKTLRLSGDAIVRLEITTRPPSPLLHKLCFVAKPVHEIQATALAGSTPVNQITIKGRTGQLVSATLEFDAISAVELGSGPAVLVDLGTVPVAQEATVGWEQIRGFSYPMRLPLTHPDYPCTPGQPEDLAAARAQARQRIQYGDPAPFTTPGPLLPTAGTIAVKTGSPVVTGSDTNWGLDLVDTALQVGGDPTAYAVLAVLSPNRLVLSRNYAGASRSGAAYTIRRDPFGQLYNDLVALVVGGPAAGAMAKRSLPSPVTEAGLVDVEEGVAIVAGTGTAWSADLVGLAFAVAGDQTTYTVMTVESATRLTLDRSYAGPTASGKPYRITALLQPVDPEGDAPHMPAQFLLEVVLLGTLHPALAQAVGLYWTDTTAVPENAFDYLLLADDSGVAQLDPAKMLMLVRESGLANLDSYILFNKRAEPAPALAPPGDVRVFALPGSVIPVDDGGLADARNTVGLRWERNLSEQGVLLPGGAIMYHVWRAALGNGAAPSAPSNFALVTRDGPVLVTETTAVETPQRASDWPPFPMHAIDQALPDGWYSYQVSGIDLFGRHSANSPAGPWYQWTPPPEPRAWYYQDPPGDTVVHPFAVRLLVKTPPPRPSGIEAFALDPNDPLVVKDAAYSVWWEELRRAPWYIALPEDERRNLIGLRVRWLWTTAQMRQAPDTREFRIYYRSGHQNTLFGHAVSVATPSATESVVATDIANNQPADSYAEGWLRVGTDAFSIVASEAGSPLRLRVRNIGPHDTIRPRPNAPCTLAIPPAFSAGTVSVTNGSPTVTGRGTSWSSRLIGTMFRILGEPEDYRVATVASPTQLTLDRGYARSTDVGKHYALRNPLFVDYGVPTSWDQRFFVVGYDQYWTPGEDEEGQPLRRYEVFLPTRAGLVRGGLPLRPTLADPIAYGHIGVSAADDKPYTADHPKWAGGDWGGRPGNEGRVGPAATVFRVRREPPPAPQPPPLPGGADHAYATAADYQGRSFYTYRWQPTEHLKTHVLRALDDAVFKVDWTQRPRPPLDASQVQFFPKETIEPRWTSAKRQQVSDELNRLNTLTGDTAQAMAAYRALSNDAQRVLAGLPGNEAAFTQVTIEPLDPDDPANADRRGPDDPATYTPDPNLRACLDTLDGHSTNRYFYRALSVDAVHNRGESGLSSPPIVLPSFQRPQAPRLLRIVGGNRRITLTWAAPHEQDIDRFLVFRIAHADNGRDIRQMGAPVASLPALERIVHDGEVDLGAGTDIVIAERVYASAGFDPSKDLLDGQTAVQYLPNPTAPAGTRVTGLSAPDETAVVVVYRDSKDSVQYTAWKTQPVVWIDEGVTGPRTYFYRVVVTRQADVLGGSLTIVSAPSELGVGRAVDNTPPEPPEITVIEWVRIGTDGTVYPYTDPVPAGELRLPAVRLVWTSPDPDLSSMVQCAEEPGGRFANASGWLQRGVYELVHQNDRWFQEQTYRLKVLNLAGNTNTRYAPASLPQAT